MAPPVVITYKSFVQTQPIVMIGEEANIPADNSPGVQPGYLYLVPAGRSGYQLYIAVEKTSTTDVSSTTVITFVQAAESFVPLG